jgi:outer membrane protein
MFFERQRALTWTATLFAVSAALSLPSHAAESLSQAYERALDYDATLAAARYQRDAASYAAPIARSALLPQLNASGAYSYSDSETTLAGQPPQSRAGTNESYGLTLSQALFDWQAFRSLDQARQQVALADTQLALAEQDLILRVATAYFDVLAAQDTLRFARAENEALERQLEQAKERFEVGLAAITDVQEAQARYDLTVANIIDAERERRRTELVLAEIAGSDVAPRKLQERIPLPPPNPEDPNLWSAQAQHNNLGVLSARHAVLAADYGVKVNEGARLPTVGARADYSDGRSETGTFPAESEATSIGVQVNIPLFSGLALSSRVDQARRVLDQRDAELTRTLRTVERDARDAYQTVISNAERVRALEQAVRSSRTALEASQTGLEVGTRTAIDVLDAQQFLYNAERNAAVARYGYLISVLTLSAVAGQLSPADLASLDQLLAP